MPELPEVETMRRGVLHLVGGRITDVAKTRCRRKPIGITPKLPTFRRRVRDREIIDVERIGKRVVLRLDNEDRIIFEPRMTGLVLLADPPTQEHLRVRFELDHASEPELLYWDRRGLGSVRLLSPAEFETAFARDKIGPDALAITVDELRSALADSRREIKVALLDQKIVAGVGNLYAAEILHLAGLHPQKRCNSMRAVHWDRVHAGIGEILNEAIRYEGSTLSDGTYRNALNKAGGYQNEHRVYDREGESCPTCNAGPIQRIVQCQRATFFCPSCQTKR